MNDNIKKIILVLLCLASGILGSVVTNLVYSQPAMPVVSTQASSRLDSLKLDSRFDQLVLEVEGHLTQTTNLIEAQQYDDSVVFSVDNDGNVAAAGTLSVTGGITFTGDISVANIDASGYVSATTAITSAGSLTSGDLTSGRVAIVSTGGLLADDGDLTFATDTLTATKLGAWAAAGAIDFGDENLTNVDIDSGNMSGVTISGGLTWSAAQDLNDQNLTNVDVDSGAIDGTTIGGASAAAGSFSTLNTSDIVTMDEDVDITDRLTVTIAAASDVGLTVKAAASQSADLQQWRDSDGNVLANISAGGKIQTRAGVVAESNQGGESFSGWAYGDWEAEHSGQTGSYDYTGGVYERYFTAGAAVFTQADADNQNWIVINSGDWKGAKAEIEHYIDTTHVILRGESWTSDLTDVTFSIFKPPVFSVKNNYIHNHIKPTGSLLVESIGGAYTGDKLIGVENVIGADDVETLNIRHNADGFSYTIAEKIYVEAGALGAGENATGLSIAIDDSGASSSDDTTEINAIYVETTDAYTVEKHALHVGAGFDSALMVLGGSAEDLDYGYEVSSGSVVTRTSNFTDTTSDIEIFDADNDYILIGSDATFEIIDVILAVESSKDVDLAYYYSQAGGNWTALTINRDTTNGFQNSGNITFDAPGDWAKDDEAEANGDIVNAYYIKLMRQYDSLIPQLPTEDRFTIVTDQAAGMSILGSGLVVLPYLSGIPADVANGAIWMESDGLHIYYNDAEKTVAGS